MIRTTLIMVVKDLRLFVRDKVGLMLAVLMPLVLVTVFGAIMSGVGGGGGGGMPSVEVTVLDQDDSEDSRAFVEAFAVMDGISLDRAAPEATRDDLVRLVHDGDRPFAVLLPDGFGEGTDMELFRDPGRTMSQQILTIGLVRALIEARGPDVLWDMQTRSLEAAGIPPEWAARVEAFTTPFRMAMENLFEQAEDEGHLGGDGDVGDDAEGDASGDGDSLDFQDFMTAVLPMQTQDVLPEGRQENASYMISHAVSGMTVMMLMFSLVGFARTLIEEREDGTLRRLLCAPIDPRTILLSKFLGAYVIGIGLVAILFTHASLLFDFDVLSHWDTVLVISLATVAATTGFALLIAAVATSDKQADGLSAILILVMSALGGAWMPLMFMPEAVRTAAQFTLPFWSIDAYLGAFWNGLHWTDPNILTNLGVLLGITVVLLLAASRLFRRRYMGA